MTKTAEIDVYKMSRQALLKLNDAIRDRINGDRDVYESKEYKAFVKKNKSIQKYEMPVTLVLEVVRNIDEDVVDTQYDLSIKEKGKFHGLPLQSVYLDADDLVYSDNHAFAREQKKLQKELEKLLDDWYEAAAE